LSSNSRNFSPSSVPPGSRVTCTTMPRARSNSASHPTWLLLPAPSIPSKVMNLPFTSHPF